MSLRYMFVDMNSYFASVEQQDNPALQGQPIAVVPVMTYSTCCIAVSREAKPFGVKTGTAVWEARKLCPRIRLVEARPERYVIVHNRIVDAVGRCLPVDRIASIDEMFCRLKGNDCRPDQATALARQVKDSIRASAGNWMTCSVGIASNVMLAKVGSDMMKPDGLTVIPREELPERLYSLKLTDFPGIGPRMEKRLNKCGVISVRQLCGLSVKMLSQIWGSTIHGERWFRLLRGEDVPEKRTIRRTLGHSHVMPPEVRTDEGSFGVLVRLTHKAAARLRTIGYWTGSYSVGVRYEDGSRWDAGCRFPHCQDTPTLLRAFAALWLERPNKRRPMKVQMVLADLLPAKSATPSLFECDRRATELSYAMDEVNREFGASMVYFGSMFGMRDQAPTRIAFTNIPDFDRAHN